MSANDDTPPLLEPDADLVAAARAGIDELKRRNGRVLDTEKDDERRQDER